VTQSTTPGRQTGTSSTNGTASSENPGSGGYEGEDLVCHTCGCEIMVKHWGDPKAHAQTGVFLCHCGTTMEPEHGGQTGQDARPKTTGGHAL